MKHFFYLLFTIVFFSACESETPKDPIEECNDGTDGIPNTFGGIDVADNTIQWDYNDGKPTLTLDGPFSKLKEGDPVIVFKVRHDTLRIVPNGYSKYDGVKYNLSESDITKMAKFYVDSLAGMKIYAGNADDFVILARCYLKRMGKNIPNMDQSDINEPNRFQK